jgi:two-component system chemotaxis response regulator CheY
MEKFILVIDDSPTIRSSVTFCLQKAGYSVIQAKDGENALEALIRLKKKGSMPALILTDINMPNMDGITLIQRIKATEFRFLPILVLTTEGERAMIEKGRQSGASGWIIKPFNPEELLGAIKKFVYMK